MKILIVDDEVLVRETILNILNNIGIYDVLEAEDGIEALSILEKIRPNIVISDIKMPGMDGIELLSKSRKIYEDIIFILLSGYDLFEYAQKAIHHGAFSYLLKPVSDVELKSVINNAIDILAQRAKQKEINSLNYTRGAQGTKFLMNKFLSEIVKENTITEEYYKKNINELNLHLDKDQFLIFLTSIDNLNALEIISLEDLELLKLKIEDIALDILQRNSITAYSFDFDNEKGFLLNFSSESKFKDKTNLSMIFEEILKFIKLYKGFTITIGVGIIVDNIYSLPSSFNFAQESVLQRLFKGENKVYFHEKLLLSKHTSANISFKTEQDLLNFFEKCDKLSSLNLIESLYQPFKYLEIVDKGDFYKLNFQLILLIYKIMSTFGLNSEELFGDEFVLYNSLNSHSSIVSILDFFDAKLEVCFKNIINVRIKGNNMIMEKVKEFIAINYAKDITLESISEYVHLSPSYFSKQFKRYFGENFIYYVINFRINKAKQLLKEGVYKANEVSRMVGFNDEKYFYKVFKKCTGFTPTKYKYC